MKNTMKRLLGSLLALALVVGFVGCGEEASRTEETTISTPDGESTITSEKTIESTGDNPPIPLSTEPEDPTLDSTLP